MADKKLKVTLVKSPIGYTDRVKGTLKALGLGKMHSSVEKVDNESVRGQIAKVSHLVKVEEI